MTLNMTPLRIATLRKLHEHGGPFHVKALVYDLVTRQGRAGWTSQGAARMSGKLINPLVEAGLVKKVDPFARTCELDVTITAKGVDYLKSIT